MTEGMISAAPMAMRDAGDPISSMVPPEGLRQMKLWRGEEFTFADLLDFVNPLQHIPIISTIYSHLTGESPGALARFTIGGLIGGPIGLLSAAVNSALITETGKDIGQIAMATITGNGAGKSFPVSDEPRAVMAQASDRGSEYAFDRSVAPSAEMAKAASVVAYNAGDAMPNAGRIFAGMSDRGSEPMWDRVPSMGSGTILAAAPSTAPQPANLIRPAPVAPRNVVSKSASPEQVSAAGTVQSANQVASMSRKGPSQGPQMSAQHMAAHLSANQSIASRSTVSNAVRQEPALRVPGRPTGVALPATPNSAFSNSMMDALDKYEALAKSRNESAPRVDVTN